MQSWFLDFKISVMRKYIWLLTSKCVHEPLSPLSGLWHKAVLFKFISISTSTCAFQRELLCFVHTVARWLFRVWFLEGLNEPISCLFCLHPTNHLWVCDCVGRSHLSLSIVLSVTTSVWFRGWMRCSGTSTWTGFSLYVKNGIDAPRRWCFDFYKIRIYFLDWNAVISPNCFCFLRSGINLVLKIGNVACLLGIIALVC